MIKIRNKKLLLNCQGCRYYVIISLFKKTRIFTKFLPLFAQKNRKLVIEYGAFLCLNSTIKVQNLV